MHSGLLTNMLFFVCFLIGFVYIIVFFNKENRFGIILLDGRTASMAVLGISASFARP